MLAEFKHTLRRLRGQIIGWSIGLGLYGLLMIYFYDTMVNMDELMQMLQSYPKEMMAMFGNMMEINTPAGYLDTYYFSYMTMIIGIFTIAVCAGLLVGDEERGVLDLVLAHPVSRTGLFWGRLLGVTAATILILIVGWLSWAVPSGGTQMGLSWLEILLPFLPLLAVLLLFGTLALLLSMVLPSGRMAGMVSGALVVANFLLMGVSRMNADLEPVVKWTPLYYFQGGNAVKGLDWAALAGLLALSAVFAVAAWLLFRRRDIRVGGERSWKLPRLALRRRPAQVAS